MSLSVGHRAEHGTSSWVSKVQKGKITSLSLHLLSATHLTEHCWSCTPPELQAILAVEQGRQTTDR